MQCLESKLDGSNYIHNCFLKTRKYFCGFVQKTTIKNHRKDGGVKYVSISSTPIYREFKSGWVRTYVCQKLLIWFRGYIQNFFATADNFVASYCWSNRVDQIFIQKRIIVNCLVRFTLLRHQYPAVAHILIHSVNLLVWPESGL